VVLGVLLAVLAGCPGILPEASFAPGDGEDDFGTLDDGLGNRFQIAPDAGNGFQVAAEGVQGDGGFVVDEFGRLSQLTTPGGSVLNVRYLEDGSIRLSGFVILLGQAFDFDVIVPAEDVPIQIVDDDPGVEQTTCVSIDNFCVATQEFLDVLLPLAKESLLQLAGVPSGNNLQDAVLIGVIDSLLSDAVGQVDNFCDGWDNLTLMSGAPCE
jgi:hypothetical protein